MMITRERVEDVLLRMGMSVNLKGFGYIRDSVLMLDAEKDIKLTYLYFKIAKEYGTTAQGVERAIRHAFETVRNCKADFEVVEYYIGFINCSNSASLSMLRMRIKEELKKQGIHNVNEMLLPYITENRLQELIRESFNEFLMEIAGRLIFSARADIEN